MRHPRESELLALLDRETDPSREAALRDHLDACAACASRLADLATLVSENRAALAVLDAEPPAASADGILRAATPRADAGDGSPGSARLLRAAAVGVLLLAAGAAAAWPGSPIREAALRLLSGDAPRVAAPGAAPDTVSTAVVVRPGMRLVVAFLARQDRGAIRVTVEPVDVARVEATAPAVHFAVGGDSIAVRNAGATGDYQVVLPADLSDAAVRVAGVVVYRREATAASDTTIRFDTLE